VLLEARSPGGVGHPANVGRENCPKSAKYVAFLDADDSMEPNALQQLATLASSLSLDAAMGDFVRVTSPLSHVLAPAYDRHITKTLPRNLVIHPIMMPELFRLSPVPWRKLYDIRFLEVNRVEFPEGDFFYEDNAFHWDVLLHATRVAYIDRAIIKHVVGGQHQTTAYLTDSSRATALSGFFANLRVIQSLILQQNQSQAATSHLKSDPVSEFITFLSRSKWVARMQTTIILRRKFGRVLVRLVEEFIQMSNSNALRYLLESNRIVDFSTRLPPKPQLSIVIPCRNVVKFLAPLVIKLLKLEDRGIDVEVFVVDDGSEDGTPHLAAKIAKNTQIGRLYVLNAASAGAGKARNRALPLLEGEYTLFIDADDEVNIDALILTLRYARTHSENDLIFFPYAINSANIFKDMWQSDRSAFIEVKGVTKLDASRHQRRTFLNSLGLTNYPWNRLARTALLHRCDIYFGSTTVHNDVRFHWTTIAAARGRISFYNSNIPVIIHAKNLRPTLTSIVDVTRTQVFDALEETRRALNPVFFVDVGARQAWRAFALKLVKWAAPRISPNLNFKARTRCAHALLLKSDTLEDKQRAHRICLFHFPHGLPKELDGSKRDNVTVKAEGCKVYDWTVFVGSNGTQLTTRHEKRRERRAKRAQTRSAKGTPKDTKSRGRY
jgi:glycosyltransferase involved in cell wall biosynthesis